jgi:hypothetical protein
VTPRADHPQDLNPLTACLIALAGTPDDTSWIDSQLITIAQLSADLIAPVTYASVTAYRGSVLATVATSSETAHAVDRAQYKDQEGPCLEALDTASPVVVPDVAAVVRWPGFRERAHQLGIATSLSIPLFAGRGTATASLNLYGRDATSLAPLSDAVRAAYDPPSDLRPQEGPESTCDDGGKALVAGIVGAFAVQAGIQQAIGAVMATTHRTAESSKLLLRMRAAETGAGLADAAAAILAERQW